MAHLARAFGVHRVVLVILILCGFCVGLCVAPLRSSAVTPGIINYQGRVQVNGADFTGAGSFYFALVDGTNGKNLWTDDGSNIGSGVRPTVPVAITVTKGLYSVVLGNTDGTFPPTFTGGAIPATVFNNSDVRLRIWFDDGKNGIQQLSPDQRISAVGYALYATSVDGGTGNFVSSTGAASVIATNSGGGPAAIFNGAIQSASGGITYPDGNTQVTAATPAAARVFSVAAQNVSSTLPPSAIKFEQIARYKTDPTMHDTAPANNTKLVCKTPGVYTITASVGFSMVGVVSNRVIQIKKNGTTIIADSHFFCVANEDLRRTVTTQDSLGVGEYVEVYVTCNNSDCTLVVQPNSSPEFMMAKLP